MTSPSSFIVTCFFNLFAQGFFTPSLKSYSSLMSFTSSFVPVCLAGKNDADQFFRCFQTMCNLSTVADHKSLFIVRMIRIRNQQAVFIGKYCGSFLEGNAMFFRLESSLFSSHSYLRKLSYKKLRIIIVLRSSCFLFIFLFFSLLSETACR